MLKNLLYLQNIRCSVLFYSKKKKSFHIRYHTLLCGLYPFLLSLTIFSKKRSSLARVCPSTLLIAMRCEHISPSSSTESVRAIGKCFIFSIRCEEFSFITINMYAVLESFGSDFVQSILHAFAFCLSLYRLLVQRRNRQQTHTDPLYESVWTY